MMRISRKLEPAFQNLEMQEGTSDSNIIEEEIQEALG